MAEKAQRVHELLRRAKLVFARVVSAAVALLGAGIVGIAVWKLRDALGTMTPWVLASVTTLPEHP